MLVFFVISKKPINGLFKVFFKKLKKKACAKRLAPNLIKSLYLAKITNLKAKIINLKKLVFKN